jgi:hypothetical protein
VTTGGVFQQLAAKPGGSLCSAGNHANFSEKMVRKEHGFSSAHFKGTCAIDKGINPYQSTT